MRIVNQRYVPKPFRVRGQNHCGLLGFRAVAALVQVDHSRAQFFQGVHQVEPEDGWHSLEPTDGIRRMFDNATATNTQNQEEERQRQQQDRISNDELRQLLWSNIR